MDILAGYFGLSLAFVIISSVFLCFIIGSKINVSVKAVLIPLVVWFTLVLYYTPGKLMGWPNPGEPPDNSIILLYLIKEPAGDKAGFIDMLVIMNDTSKRSFVDQLAPVNVFGYTDTNAERMFRLPYERKLHEELVEKSKEAKRKGGVLRYKRKKGKPGSGEEGEAKGKPGEKEMKEGGKMRSGGGMISEHEDDSRIMVVNPTTLIDKDAD